VISVIPAQAGIHAPAFFESVDPGLRRDDGKDRFY
jgi:hypothetical protein